MRNFLAHLPKLSWLVLMFPVVLGMHFAHVEGVPLFIASAIGILGTVCVIGKATEQLAIYFGPVWGGLINATFANVTELIIAVTALQNPALHGVVRSSITGSILGNLLLVLGAAMFYGGMKYPTQTFSRTGASVNLGMLWVTVIALLVPTFVHLAHNTDPKLAHIPPPEMLHLVEKISFAAAIILLAIYGMSLIFSLKTHRYLLMPQSEEEGEQPLCSRGLAIFILLAATVVVAIQAEIFVDAMTTVLKTVKISELFLGVIVVAVVGNAAEGSVAVWVARENKMELSYQIAMGSCLQVALMVAPVLVLISFAIGKPLTLAFNPFELAALISAVLISSSSLQDGESNWLEGAMFLAVYVFFAVVFWYHP